MIQNLWKTEVYEMAKFLVETNPDKAQADALDLCIKAVPTDGLGISNSDFDQLGAYSYQEVDQILIAHLKDPHNEDLLHHKVIQRKLNSEFKRNNPFSIPRERISDSQYF
jgi:NH3-dependent NAD+ synthetase